MKSVQSNALGSDHHQIIQDNEINSKARNIKEVNDED